ncbi:MAG: glycosyltransferase family 4 protein [Brumimicrobium sp.]
MSKKIYILAPYPKGEAPSQRFRFEQYIESFEKEGYEVSFYAFLNGKIWKTLYTKGNTLYKIVGILNSFLRRWALLFHIKKADYVFIHRETAHLGPPVFEWVLSKVLGVKYIYDFDDAIWLPNFSAINAKYNRLKAYWKIKYCIKWAHQITAGNEYLADYAKQFNSNVKVIPTTIDLVNHHNLSTNQEKPLLTIGWTGTHTTMRYLDFIVPIITKLEKEHKFEFRVISNEAPNYKLKSLHFVKWQKETEIQDLAEINIGIMPLEEDVWSKGKCGFKALQYMALEIPTIASPVGVNKEIISHGNNGFLCNTVEEWEKTLRQLIKDKSLRKSIGLKGKNTVKEKFSVEANLNNYLALFK